MKEVLGSGMLLAAGGGMPAFLAFALEQQTEAVWEVVTQAVTENHYNLYRLTDSD